MAKHITLPTEPEQRSARKGRGRPQKTYRPPADEDLTHKGYYITVTQYKAIKLRAAQTEDFDMSGIVRAALDQYLKREIKEIKGKENEK